MNAKKILIADDMDTNQKQLSRFVKACADQLEVKCEITVVGSVEEALRESEINNYDLILMDNNFTAAMLKGYRLHGIDYYLKTTYENRQKTIFHTSEPAILQDLLRQYAPNDNVKVLKKPRKSEELLTEVAAHLLK